MVDLPGISYDARVPNPLPNPPPKQVQSKEELQLPQESCVFISESNRVADAPGPLMAASMADK
jgi:hypothetical protein